MNIFYYYNNIKYLKYNKYNIFFIKLTCATLIVKYITFIAISQKLNVDT